MSKYMPIPFIEARSFKLTFGRYEGDELDEIASSEAGLLYLDWLRGIRLDFHTKNAVNSYLDDPTIAKDLADLIDGAKK